MAKQVVKSGLAAKYGSKLDTAVKTHAEDETTYGQMDLPGGIKGGIAQLTKCYFDQYKTGDYKGEYYFRAQGIVIEPKSHEGLPIAGLMTSYMEPVCDTINKTKKETTTQEEHIDRILNEMRKLGAETKGASGSDLESLAAGLEQSKPYFRFETSVGAATPQFPNPRVFHNWYGSKGLEDYVPDEAPAVEDNTAASGGDEPPTESPAAAQSEEDWDALAASADGGDAEAQQTLEALAIAAGVDPSVIDDWAGVVAAMREGAPGEVEGGSEEAVDWVALGEEGDTDDGQEARDKLQEAATAAGLDPDSYPSWAELGAALAEGSPEDAPAEEEIAPEVGNIFFYKPVDPKTKKPAKKAIECEVKAVFAAAKKVNLLNLDDKKTSYKSIPWSELEQG